MTVKSDLQHHLEVCPFLSHCLNSLQASSNTLLKRWLGIGCLAEFSAQPKTYKDLELLHCTALFFFLYVLRAMLYSRFSFFFSRIVTAPQVERKR